MQFRDLGEQYILHETEITDAIKSVLSRGEFIHGREVIELEEKLADYVGAKYCITCANGTDALQLALMAWDVGPGDAVFVPDFTFFSSGEVVSAIGATPVFVDVCDDSFNINPLKLEEAINKVQRSNTLSAKAVIAVDLFGQPADYPVIKEICKKHNILLLEDGAQGFGGKIENKRACGFGDIGTTSFFPAKPLGCYGDGGAVFTNDGEWAKIIRSLCVHGKGSDKYDNIRIGMNSRLDTLQAAILIEKLHFFDDEIKRCNELADLYNEQLSQLVRTPVIRENYYSSWAQYTVLLENKEERETVMASLKERGIPSAIYYKKPMHRQKAFDSIQCSDEDFVSTNTICDKCLSLPMHPYLKEESIVEIKEVIGRCANRLKD